MTRGRWAPGRRALVLTASALLWSVGLLVAALVVPVSGSATLVDQNGSGILLVIAIPAVVSALAWIALWRKCARGGRVSGYVAWTCVWVLSGFCVLAILSIGVFVAPAAVLLALAAKGTPSGAT